MFQKEEKSEEVAGTLEEEERGELRISREKLKRKMMKMMIKEELAREKSHSDSIKFKERMYSAEKKWLTFTRADRETRTRRRACAEECKVLS